MLAPPRLALSLLALAGPMVAQQPAPATGGFRLVPRPATPEPAATPLPWAPSFAAAQSAAKERRRTLLLFFTATW